MTKSTCSIDWQFYPKSSLPPEKLQSLVSVFVQNIDKISSDKNHKLSSNEILELLKDDLIKIGFQVETGKKAEQKLRRPVLFGRNGKLEKAFDVDAYEPATQTVVEVEAGRAVTNNQFLKDFFEALIMIGIDYLGIAVRKDYHGNPDFDNVTKFFDALYVSERFTPALKGLLIIGY